MCNQYIYLSRSDTLKWVYLFMAPVSLYIGSAGAKALSCVLPTPAAVSLEVPMVEQKRRLRPQVCRWSRGNHCSRTPRVVSVRGVKVGGVVCCLQHVLNICMPTNMSRVDATAAVAACQGPRVSRKTILHSPRAGSQRFTSPSLRSGSNQVNIIIRSQ